MDLPSHKSFWKLPAASEHGDQQADTMLAHVGLLTSSWEVLESRFARLFEFFIDPATTNAAASRAYGAIGSNAGRRRALSEASEVFFHQHGLLYDDSEPNHSDARQKKEEHPVRNVLSKLVLHFDEASHLRDNVAHGIVTEVFVQDRSLGIFLCPPFYYSYRTSAFTDETPWRQSTGIAGLEKCECQLQYRTRGVGRQPTPGERVLAQARLAIRLKDSHGSSIGEMVIPPLDSWAVFKWDYRYTSSDIGQLIEKISTLMAWLDAYLGQLKSYRRGGGSAVPTD